MMTVHQKVAEVTARIQKRSQTTREAYLRRMEAANIQGPHRGALSCGNLAHGFAACGSFDKKTLKGAAAANIAIVSAYNDMLSAHQPLEAYPALIKEAARQAGGTAQFAGGVPAMCDGVTQGRPGMELSLFSRDVIALSTAVALSHNMFDGALCLGVCDKIVPGMLIGALSFGHLPFIFVPAGPMPSGLPNKKKAEVRQRFAAGEIGREELLEAESKSYHSAGTCTFYGTANTNQMLMEVMGIHLPGSAFVPPKSQLRTRLVQAATQQLFRINALGEDYRPLGRIIDERAVVNGMIGLIASGGSTNLTIHLIAIARAAGIQINWSDMSDLSAVTPLIMRVYPNGQADVNHFHAAGGTPFFVRELLGAGFLQEIETVVPEGMAAYTREPVEDGDGITWRPAPQTSGDAAVLTTASAPFSPNGGLRLLDGNLGRGVIKVSAVAAEHLIVEAPARVFNSQDELLETFRNGNLSGDMVAVVRYQGPKANGMPELHKLTPTLGVLQDRGFKVALVTDGRMSGASGKVPAAIHVTPECNDGGPLAKVRDGDLIRLDAEAGTLNALVPDQAWAARPMAEVDLSGNETGMGRELFKAFRAVAGSAEEGGAVF